jgi:hypothetical protein
VLWSTCDCASVPAFAERLGRTLCASHSDHAAVPAAAQHSSDVAVGARCSARRALRQLVQLTSQLACQHHSPDSTQCTCAGTGGCVLLGHGDVVRSGAPPPVPRSLLQGRRLHRVRLQGRRAPAAASQVRVIAVRAALRFDIMCFLVYGTLLPRSLMTVNAKSVAWLYA